MKNIDVFQTEENIQAFRDTFNSKQGKKTFDIIMQLCGLTDVDIIDPGSVGKRNLASQIIAMLGVDDNARSGDVASAITDGIFNAIKTIPITIKKEIKKQ